MNELVQIYLADGCKEEYFSNNGVFSIEELTIGENSKRLGSCEIEKVIDENHIIWTQMCAW